MTREQAFIAAFHAAHMSFLGERSTACVFTDKPGGCPINERYADALLARDEPWAVL